MLSTKFQFIRESAFRGEDCFRNQPMRNKNGLQRPCLLTDRDEISNFVREPSTDASYQVSVHLTKWFQRRRFKKNRPIRNKNCLWRPCLSMDRDKMSNLYREPSIDASYQISVHLGKWFQRRRVFQISANQKQEWPVAAMFVNGSEINEQFFRGPSKDASYQVVVHLVRLTDNVHHIVFQLLNCRSRKK